MLNQSFSAFDLNRTSTEHWPDTALSIGGATGILS
jgi:hypothetical protein